MPPRQRISETCNHRTPDKLPVDFGGGFIFCSIHNVQPGTPIENLLAMFEVAPEYR